MLEKKTFAEKHPRLNAMVGLLMLLGMVAIAAWMIDGVISFMREGIISLVEFIKNFVRGTDKVIVVAMITGAVSIVGVVISSIVAKIVDYRYKVKQYLYDKREEPYTQFIEMIYAMMEDTKKKDEDKMTEEELTKKVSEFSKGLTLWGSNRVVQKWLKYRRSALSQNNPKILLELEDIIYEIRRDVGLRRRLKKGDMLSFFINDYEEIKKLLK